MKKDEVKVILKTVMVISYMNLLLCIINLFVRSEDLVFFTLGSNIALVIISFVGAKTSMHNLKVEIKEFNKKAGFREDFDWTTRWQLKTKVKGCEVSTVDLGLDHSFGIGAPLYYETMIFGDDRFEGYQERYSTKKEAKKGHKKAIKYVKEKLKEDK